MVDIMSAVMTGGPEGMKKYMSDPGMYVCEGQKEGLIGSYSM
jgi:hypothetical protein